MVGEGATFQGYVGIANAAKDAELFAFFLSPGHFNFNNWITQLPNTQQKVINNCEHAPRFSTRTYGPL